jgi:hypothetical protein
MMHCPFCTDADTIMKHDFNAFIQYDEWWCAACGASWKATFRGEFIELIRAGA